MSAASPNVQDKGQEPSMEEILASIRRIIADDQAGKTDADAPAPEPQDDDVLDLAEVAQPVMRRVEPTPPPPPLAPEPEPEPEPSFDMQDFAFDGDEIAFAEPEPEPKAPPAEPKVPLEAAIEREAVSRLVSKATDESVGRAFNLLSHTVLSQNARTLEDLVADMLRPLLREWLDDNLPSMVERLVRAEIERVARGH